MSKRKRPQFRESPSQPFFGYHATLTLRDIQKTAARETTLPVDVGRSELSLLKLPILWRIPEKITFNLFLVLESKSLYLVKHYSECFYGDSLVINKVG